MRKATSALLVAIFLGACGGAGVPAAGPSRESGQSSLMDNTFAGQNKCNPKSHERPFVVEWDATDISSFQARANTDVVFVKYEGCELKIVEGCRPTVPAEFGTYRTPDWTTGSMETIDISNQGDLYAKLPLGAATLGGRVSAGEQFKMEYYVSGTASATREEVTKAELASVPGCKGVTHFVYGFNLGAFALGSTKELKGEVEGSIFGFGGGAAQARKHKADKKGGDLSKCKAESMKEVMECKAPIRLTLRELSDGEAPKVASAKAPETPTAQSMAGQLKADSEKEKEAVARFQDATRKMLAGDGKGCLADLDTHDRLDPRPDGLSNNPKSQNAGLRAQCIMLNGQCDAGKQLLRKVQEMYMQGQSAEVIDRAVENVAADKCRGGQRSARDELLNAWSQLQTTAQTAATCDAAYATVKRLRPTVKPNDDSDYHMVAIHKHPADIIAGCYVRASACDKAWEAFRVEEGTTR